MSFRIDDLEPSGALQPVPASDIDRAEADLGTPFPSGYRDLMQRFGRGIVGGLVRVYTPFDIASGDNSVTEWRKRIDEYWFWDAGAAVLTKAQALECVILGDTVGGDEMVFHPSAPDRIYVLPHDSDDIHVAGDGLEAALDWFFTSGVIDPPFEDKSFEPY